MMAKWNRNGEGYADSTAGIAVQKVSREERKIAMGKKRSCRRTTDESIIHEKAVKMRKMRRDHGGLMLRTGWKRQGARDLIKAKR